MKKLKKETVEEKLDRIIGLLESIPKYPLYVVNPQSIPPTTTPNQGGYLCPRCHGWIPNGDNHYC